MNTIDDTRLDVFFARPFASLLSMF